MDIVNALAEQYAERFTGSESPLLKEIAADTYANHAQPHMLSGHVQGKFLEMISFLLRPHRILEIGTFTGYSGLCLAAGLDQGGELHTIELRKEDAELATSWFKKANWLDRIILHEGNALEIIPDLQETWDLVFIDADKVNYTAYYQLVLPRVRSGGLIIADNVFFHGQVLEEKITGKSALGIQAFNEMIEKDESVDKVMLTVRDGLLLIQKNKREWSCGQN